MIFQLMIEAMSFIKKVLSDNMACNVFGLVITRAEQERNRNNSL